MASFPKPDTPKLPALPGGGQPQVPQPGQLVPASPAPRAGRNSAEVTGPPTAVRVQDGPARSTDYVDPILFAEGFFNNKADYNETVRLAVAKIKSSQIQPRQPDLDEEEIRGGSQSAIAGDIVASFTSSSNFKKAMDSLTPEQRQIVDMLYFEGLTQSEAAARLELPLGTIERRARAALRKLAAVLR